MYYVELPYLICGCVQVRCGHVQQVILDNVDQRWHADLQRVHGLLHNGRVQDTLPAEYILALLQEHQHQARQQLDELGHENSWKGSGRIKWFHSFKFNRKGTIRDKTKLSPTDEAQVH